jgi:eukaryotic-like serine/threonine-protein kinase
MPLESGARVGPYQITGPLGAGGMGEVYRATDTNLGRQVAIKVLPASLASDVERLARFEREAKTLAALNHPNIAAIYGLERTGSTTALVMELVEGPTLADRIAEGPMALEDVLPIAAQITDALAAAHDQGIVHRDLKPANIKVRPDGMVKVLDFGLAKTIEPAAAGAGVALSLSPTITSPAMTQAGMLLGTAAYMSPEQARGRAVDKRADIWAFGCVLFEMVTGRRAFKGDDVTETIAAVMRDQPDLNHAPASLRRALARCFEKDPRKRLRDIGDVWALLDDRGHTSELRAEITPAWRRVLPWGLVGAATAVAVVMSVSHLTETRFSPHPVRFQLQIPAEAGSTTPVISPDGTRVAYRATGQIWVRDLDSLESRPLASTDRPVGRVFWSADSRFVMYGAAGKLMRIAAAGGSPETLRDLPQVLSGGIGLPDGGMILNTVADPVTGVSETRHIHERGESRLSTIHAEAWLERGAATLLPDGKRFVYSVHEPEALRGVYVASIDGATAPERLLPESSPSAYAPSVNREDEGYLLLLRQDTLVALPVEAAGLRPRGEPLVLAKGVGSFTMSGGDSLVYRSIAGRRLTWYDRDGVSTGTAWSLAPYMEIALSPDATRLVAVRADGPTTWFHEFASESSVRASATRAVVVKPVWVPTGDRLTVVSNNRTGQAEILTLGASGNGGEELVLRVPGVAYPTSWSNDGRSLLYTNVDPRSKEDLWVVTTTASGAGKPQPFLVTDNKETDGTFSPDGQAVAYVSDESGTGNVYLRSFPSAGGRKWQVSIGGGYQPRWRRDGRELFYMSPSGQLMSVAITPGLASPPGRPMPLFQTAIFGGGPSVNNWYWDVTPDGQRFLINTVIPGNDPSTLNVVLNWQSSPGR